MTGRPFVLGDSDTGLPFNPTPEQAEQVLTAYKEAMPKLEAGAQGIHPVLGEIKQLLTGDKVSYLYAELDYSEPTPENQPSRHIRLYTGAGGMDLVEEAFLAHDGKQRLYISKPPRFVARALGVRFHRSCAGRWFRIVNL